MKRWADISDSTSDEEEPRKKAFNELMKHKDDSYVGPPLPNFDDSKTGMNKKFRSSTTLEEERPSIPETMEANHVTLTLPQETHASNASNFKESAQDANQAINFAAFNATLDTEPAKRDNNIMSFSLFASSLGDQEIYPLSSKFNSRAHPSNAKRFNSSRNYVTPNPKPGSRNNWNGNNDFEDRRPPTPQETASNLKKKTSQKRKKQSADKKQLGGLTSDKIAKVNDGLFSETDFPPLTVKASDSSSLTGFFSVTSSTVWHDSKKKRLSSTTSNAATSQLGDDDLNEMMLCNMTSEEKTAWVEENYSDIRKKKSTVDYKDYIALRPKEEREDNDPVTPKAESMIALGKRQRKLQAEEWMFSVRERVWGLRKAKGVEKGNVTPQTKDACSISPESHAKLQQQSAVVKKKEPEETPEERPQLEVIEEDAMAEVQAEEHGRLPRAEVKA